MPIVPIRGLAAKGILRDPSPYELDLDAWSGGVNMRFHTNMAERAPGFRIAQDALPEAPTFCIGVEPIGAGYDSVMTVGADGRIWQFGAGTFIEVTEPGHTNATDPRAITGTFLSDVLYVNRPDGPPRYFGPSSSTFATLPNMETTWTARSLRAFGDYLVALNVTKPTTFTDPYSGLTVSGGSLPSLVKWSDLTLAGQVPAIWDPDNPNSSAGENILGELQTPLVDGVPMRNIFVLYSEDQIWAMEQSGNEQVFVFEKMFDEGGMIAPNCGVEVDGVHYVFGPNDIYKHDGNNKESIIDKRNKQTFYRYLNRQKSEVCFVAYMPQYTSVVFACNSSDPKAAFSGTACDRCNWAAVYDLSADTWAFIDLPNVSAMTQANIDTILTWASAPDTLTWANVGGSWYDQDNTFTKHTMVCSGAISGLFTQSRLLAYDFIDKGVLTLPLSSECTPPAFVERVGIALDQLGSDLQTYKKVRRMLPLINTYHSVQVQVQIGGAEVPSGTPTFLPAVSFDPTKQYKLDGIKGGRYLAVRFTVSTLDDFEVAGYDLDVTNAGRR